MTAQECYDNGYRYYCLNCNKIYKDIPTPDYMAFPGVQPDMCNCGCDLFGTFEELIKNNK